jgi:hypothetical protein
MGSLKKCISVSEEFSNLAEQNKISWTEASRIGMSIILAERGIDVFNNELKEKRLKMFKEKKIEVLNDTIRNQSQ